MNIPFTVTNQQISTTADVPLVADSVGAVTCSFTFDAQWDGYAKTVIFTSRSYARADVSVQVVYAPSVIVPHEVLRTGRLYLSVVGVKDGKRLTTARTEGLPVLCAGEQTGSNAAQYTAPLWEQMLSTLASLDEAQF